MDIAVEVLYMLKRLVREKFGILLSQVPPARRNLGFAIVNAFSNAANNIQYLCSATGQTFTPAVITFRQLNRIAG